MSTQQIPGVEVCGIVPDRSFKGGGFRGSVGEPASHGQAFGLSSRKVINGRGTAGIPPDGFVKQSQGLSVKSRVQEIGDNVEDRFVHPADRGEPFVR